MTTYTKQVTIAYTSIEERNGSETNEFTAARFAKGEELIASGKTDGIVTINNNNASSSRKFVDQESAEEFLNFVLASAATNNVTIVSSSITDL